MLGQHDSLQPTGPGKDKKKTLTMKIYLEAEELPSHIELMSERFKVSQFFEKPWQCYKCQKFGHNAYACSGETKCVFLLWQPQS